MITTCWSLLNIYMVEAGTPSQFSHSSGNLLSHSHIDTFPPLSTHPLWLSNPNSFGRKISQLSIYSPLSQVLIPVLARAITFSICFQRADPGHSLPAKRQRRHSQEPANWKCKWRELGPLEMSDFLTTCLSDYAIHSCLGKMAPGTSCTWSIRNCNCSLFVINTFLRIRANRGSP